MPRIGLLADSHGRTDTTQLAVDVLLQAGAERLLHLGDVGTEAVLTCLVAAGPGEEEPVPAHVVFGNGDEPIGSLERTARHLGLKVDHPAGELALGAKRLVFCHGHQPGPMNRALKEEAAYLCHGHTHRARDERHGATRVINPGALFRARQYTVAVLETDGDELRFLPVHRG